jgi:hypothetical protein
MTTQHTPGPWKEMDGFIVGGPWADGEFHDICDPRCAPPDDDNTGMINANAQLIAAAPDLLEALQGYVAHIESCRAAWEEDGAERNTKMHGLAVALNNIFGDRIKEAIAKATGEPVMAA